MSSRASRGISFREVFNLIAAIAFLLLAAISNSAADNFVWVEGESPTSTNMKPHPWYAGAVNKAELSGGDFISNFGPEEGRADYQFPATQAGSYTFWIRANPVGDPKLDYQLNGGDWIPVDFTNKSDLINIAKDSKPDLRFIAWIKVGSVNLNAGANTIAFKFHSGNNNHGSLDCFLFTQAPFTPNGKLKPGQKLGTDETGWWAFEPGPENFGKDALLDLHSLNENEAGQSGFIQADGDCFKLGNGQPVRFWAVNSGAPPGDMSKEQMDFMAARFAKLGINMVRIHGGLFDRSGDDPTKIDPARLDNYFYLIYALKKQGIYVHLSNYFPLWLTVKASDGIPGTDDIIGKFPSASSSSSHACRRSINRGSSKSSPRKVPTPARRSRRKRRSASSRSRMKTVSSFGRFNPLPSAKAPVNFWRKNSAFGWQLNTVRSIRPLPRGWATNIPMTAPPMHARDFTAPLK